MHASYYVVFGDATLNSSKVWMIVYTYHTKTHKLHYECAYDTSSSCSMRKIYYTHHMSRVAMNTQVLLQITLMRERFLTPQQNRCCPVWVHSWVFRESLLLRLFYTKYMKMHSPLQVAAVWGHPLWWKICYIRRKLVLSTMAHRWTLKCCSRGKDFLHILHKSECLPLWVHSWLVKRRCWAKDFLHTSHENGRSLLCMCRWT